MALESDRTSFISTQESKENAENRTAPVYTISDGQLALNDVLKPKPNDFNGQIDITWIDEALEKKAFESKYSAWDLIKFPYGYSTCSAFGNNIGVFIYPNLAVLTNSFGDILENVNLNNSDITTITYAEYQIENINEIGEVTYTDIKAFVMLSLDGKCYYTLDNFKTIKEFIIPNDSYNKIIFYNNHFFAFTTTGKIYKSDKQGKEISNIVTFDIEFYSASFNDDGCIISCGGGTYKKDKIVYSLDFGETWHSLEVTTNSNYTDIVYGEGKFICCSPDGVEKLLVIKYDEENKNLSAYPKTLIKDYQFIKLSYGARVFVLISLDGSILSSYDGENFIETKSALTGFIHILRTDKFFIALSYVENDTYNAVRSANGGLNSIDFATVQEIIDNEKTNKSIDIQGVNGWFDWLENERGITAQDVRITLISETSNIKSYNEILRAGEYYIFTNLNDKPDENFITGRLRVQYIKNNNEIYITQIFETYIENKYFKFQRQFSKTDVDKKNFPNWSKTNVYQSEIHKIDLSLDNIEVSKDVTISAVTTFLAVDNDGNVTNIESIDLSDNKIKVSKTVTQSAVKTFLIVDSKGNVKQSTLEEIKEFIGLKKLAYKDIIETEDIKDGAIDLNSNKTSGVLPINKGGTGNYIGRSEFTSNVDLVKYLNIPAGTYTFQQLITDYIKPNSSKLYGFMTCFYIWNNNSSVSITGIPLNPTILTIIHINANYLRFEARGAYNNLSLYIGTANDWNFTGWKQVLYPNGSPFGTHETINRYKNYACSADKAPFFKAPTMTIKEFLRASHDYTATMYKDGVLQMYFLYKKHITDIPEDLIIELYNSETVGSNTSSFIARGYLTENIYFYNYNKSSAGFVKLNNNSLSSSDIINVIKTNPSLFRQALGLGSLATLNSVNLSDLTKTTGILPSARGGFNYNDYLV